MEQGVKTVLFYRHFPQFSGGALKGWDYFNHVLSSPRHTARICFSSESVWDESNPWVARRDLVVEPGEVEPDILFLSGVDWALLPPEQRERSPVPIINNIGHVLHGDPDDPLGRYEFLQHKAIRICGSPDVEAALRVTGRVNGPIFTIPRGIDFGELPPPLPPEERDIDLLIVANKRRKRGRMIRDQLARPGRRIHLIDSLVLRADFLRLLARSRVTLFLPNKKEGFFIPAIEGMALRTIVVCPDCIGNRSFCLPGENCLRPAWIPEEILEATEAAVTDPSSHDHLVEGAAATVQNHRLDRERRQFLGVLDRVDEIWNSG
jgi:glycosyltransferase involved in cell wall biosynthesis